MSREDLASLRELLKAENPTPALTFTLQIYEMIVRHDVQIENMEKNIRRLEKFRSKQQAYMIATLTSVVLILLSTVLL